MMNKKAIFYLVLIFLITVFPASSSGANQPSLTEAMVKNVILSWYQGTNDHKPLADQLALLTDDVEMRYQILRNHSQAKKHSVNGMQTSFPNTLTKHIKLSHGISSSLGSSPLLNWWSGGNGAGGILEKPLATTRHPFRASIWNL